MEKTSKFQAFLDFLSRPAFITPEHIRAQAEMEKAKNPQQITLIKNIFITKMKDKKTGKVIDIDPDKYEIINTKIIEQVENED